MKIYFLGPFGTNSDLAARHIFKATQYNFIPLRSIEDIFEKVALSHTYYGVIPFENSYQGVINSSLNGLIDYDLKITKELNFKIIHSFCSKNVVIENVTKIASHPQVFGQCNDWLKRNYPSVEKVVCTSTAEAAEMAKHDSSIYCIANDYAKDLFGLNMHETNIQDSDNNVTRFLVIGKMIENKGKENKTSIMINLSDKPGALLSILKPFAENDINMTRIETRPSRNNDFQHTFFIDFEGYYEDDKVAELLSTLEQMSKELRIIGSYEILY
ncbi:MAG: prephenate dehydratase [Gammaproteobacteria bacterium]|nr:prephenate dehydratase [Gammaproteobacteria bacterium]